MKKNWLFDKTIEHGQITIGTVVGMGVTGRIGEQLHTPSSGRIMQGMNTMRILPTVHSSGIALGSLRFLEDVGKKKKW